MTKRIRTIAGFLMGLFMVLSIMAPSMAMAATVRPETGNLYIHKIQTNYNPFDDTLIENDGLTKDLPADSTFLEGAEFSVYKVADDAELPVDITGISPVVETTDSSGLALFENLAQGRYYVVETNTPKGVEEFSPPFLVDVPMMNPNGTEWNENVHVYPKNQLILGAVELTKWDEDGETGLAGATFSLYKEEDGDDVLIASDLVTDANGNIFVGDLVVGNYYFVETAAPDGYGLNTTPITFEVTKDDHAYGLGNDSSDENVIDEKIIREGVELMNYDLPDIQKFVTTVDNKVETADFNENILWIIQPEVPGDIATYDSFVIVDTFGPEMTFNNDVTINDGAITDFTVDFTSNVLTIDITPSALEGVTELTVEFTTFFNDTAIMGMDYYNSVDLEFNNGYDDYDATEEDEPYAHTGGKAFEKVNKEGEGLPGAEFLIHKGEGMYLQSDYSWGAKATAWTFVSDANGYFEIKGLAYGDYYLEEIKAPEVDGIQYRLLDDDYEFTVDANSYYSNVADLVAADPAEVLNSPEITLPQTGGVGTLVFSIIGLGLMGSSIKLYKKSEK
ncbi:LPXTG-motif cell wall anchor domain-containing protein/fimbrial isopeptide formation D2 domain-containing protein [Alkalibacterium subtropicum]|uniref:LPXTG-motif cell wall anchor domain-containing protein/fimbrial isopeptide formation D2 domain-containing protein n=1 Tax=Alkalibacterium subtropicum TaxID=753702 RepID=A0A1I1JRE3_9LACT|nr:SpaA isopeptide-forming pilin-related protein [Alkalibacterium subtropicum]SFC47940.1 LPXTG-motif cell wall anchor domain-containing protein/fimbrial isopeptide formation D2 domain-containing protein [Alkalibacterium subtropicum]